MGLKKWSHVSVLLLWPFVFNGCVTSPKSTEVHVDEEIDLRDLQPPIRRAPSPSDLIIESERLPPPSPVPAPAPTPKPKPTPTPAPTPPRRDVVLDHKFFRIVYDAEKRLAHYVVYELKADELRKPRVKRKDKFKPDPLLVRMKIPYVQPSEYLKSGYDRGHLAPSADFSWSQEANDSTFVMSNIVPQRPNLNRDAWRHLEDRVRKWACGEEHITVITGPVLVNTGVSLKSGLMVPERFFKVIVDETPPTKMVAFLFRQSDRGDIVKKRSMTVAELSRIPGVRLPQSIMSRIGIRAPANVSEWKEKDCRGAP